MKILFLDQSGHLGGAELCLLDLVRPYPDSTVGLLADGPFRQRLEESGVNVTVLTEQALKVRKDAGWQQALSSVGALVPLAGRVARLSRDYDLIYANTQKALVVGALASALSRRPLVYHLHDILSPEHFSPLTRRLAVTLANGFAARVIANSQATREAFVAAGGDRQRVSVIYNGFALEPYQAAPNPALRAELGLGDRFVVGHFSRLSPWKGQHVLLEAIAHLPESVAALFVGDALFGETAYAQQLQDQVAALGLQDRVKFLGFRPDVIPLMQACDAVVHSSTAPEPFGRVIVEAQLCQRPAIAADAGGATELITPGETGWLVRPGATLALAAAIADCQSDPERARAIAQQASRQARQRFGLPAIQAQVAQVLTAAIAPDRRSPFPASVLKP
ncbi:glycosyltransferase [Geitlerinema sp. PCC 7407]|uniref:glycosyltransferase n=1 Tax=Geitlerinema sp. PCC 7407 TaxID=1173025 RepID=UPI00029FA4DD|nr:glycosyltransferase [Geitlerinema sp. PCC 7407]AFY66674.1 glycosyl transferase group 1 [Geitlerinema sp. PCC 7407]